MGEVEGGDEGGEARKKERGVKNGGVFRRVTPSSETPWRGLVVD